MIPDDIMLTVADPMLAKCEKKPLASRRKEPQSLSECGIGMSFSEAIVCVTRARAVQVGTNSRAAAIVSIMMPAAVTSNETVMACFSMPSLDWFLPCCQLLSTWLSCPDGTLMLSR